MRILCKSLLLMLLMVVGWCQVGSAAEAPYRLGASTTVLSGVFPRGVSLWLVHPSNFGWGLAQYGNGIESVETVQNIQGFYSFRGAAAHLDLGVGAGRILMTGEFQKSYSSGTARERFVRLGVSLGRFGLHLTSVKLSEYLEKNAIDEPYNHQQAGQLYYDCNILMSGISWDF